MKQFIAYITGAQCYGCKNYLTLSDKSIIICQTCNNKIIPMMPISFIENNKIYSIYSLGRYEGPLKNILTAKYAKDISPYLFFAEKMINYINVKNILFDIIVPVPQHPLKQAQRWFNHSNELAAILSIHYKKPVFKNILCSKKTKQSTLSYKDRIKLDSETFIVIEPKQFDGKDILIVDDVFTTGSTIKALIHSMKAAKPRSINVIVAAKT